MQNHLLFLNNKFMQGTLLELLNDFIRQIHLSNVERKSEEVPCGLFKPLALSLLISCFEYLEVIDSSYLNFMTF